MSICQTRGKVNSTNAFRGASEHKNPGNFDRSQKNIIFESILRNPAKELM